MNKRKPFLRVLALLTAALLLSGCSAVISNPVVAKVGDVEVTYSEFYNLYDMYAYYGMVDGSTPEARKEAYGFIFDQLVDSALPIAAAHKQGLTLTEEERAAALEKSAATLTSYLSDFQDQTIEDEAARNAAAIKAFDKAYKGQGVTYEKVKAELEKSVLDEALGNKLAEQVKSTAGAATEEAAKTWYDEQLKTEREKYAKDATSYYYDTQYSSGVQPLVAPEGLFYVKHILIKTEDESAGANESSSASFATPEERAKAILEKVNAGEDFDALIAELGEDPGMQAEPAKTQGYVMGQGYDSVYDKAFYDAAIALKETGDTSAIVEGSFGFHIIRRVGDVSTQAVPFEDVKEDILTLLNNQEKTNVYNAAIEQWKSEINVTLYEKRVSHVGVR